MVSFAIDTSEWNVRETIMVAKISIGLMAYMIYLGWKLHTHGRTIWLEYLEHGKRGILSRGHTMALGFIVVRGHFSWKLLLVRVFLLTLYTERHQYIFLC